MRWLARSAAIKRIDIGTFTTITTHRSCGSSQSSNARRRSVRRASFAAPKPH
jgi:hypothetical protein